MSAPRGQLAYFRVFPEPTSRLHYRVRVFESTAALRKYLTRGRLPWRRSLGRYGRAMCSSWQRLKGGKMSPDCGEILFVKAWLGMEVITHESTHAAVNWANRIKLTFDRDPIVRGRSKLASPDEERFCYGLGQLAKQIAARLYERKLLPS